MNRRQAFVALVATFGLGLGALFALSGGGAHPFAPELPPPLVIVHAESGVLANLVPGEAPDGKVPLSMRVSGRVAPAPAPLPGYRHRWPGTEASVSFRGDRLSLLFEDTVNRFDLRVDGRIIVQITRPGHGMVHLRGLGPGPHSAVLQKISESGSPAVFGGFFVEDAALTMPPPEEPARQIVFYGDSDTVGYGNAHDGRDCSDLGVFMATDTTLAFPALVARHYDAGLRVIARSGLGLVRNYDGSSPGVTIVDLHATTLAEVDSGTAGREAAEVVVVGIGSNDFSTPLRPAEAWPDIEVLRADFERSLVDLLQALRTDNPEALFVLLAFGEYGEALVDSYRAALERLEESGARAKLVILGRLERTACHWHPSLRDHIAIANALISAIDTGARR